MDSKKFPITAALLSGDPREARMVEAVAEGVGSGNRFLVSVAKQAADGFAWRNRLRATVAEIVGGKF